MSSLYARRLCYAQRSIKHGAGTHRAAVGGRARPSPGTKLLDPEMAATLRLLAESTRAVAQVAQPVDRGVIPRRKECRALRLPPSPKRVRGAMG